MTEAEAKSMIANVPLDDIVNKLLPITDKDWSCMQKHIVKQKNREQFLRVMRTYIADPYCHYSFKNLDPVEEKVK